MNALSHMSAPVGLDAYEAATLERLVTKWRSHQPGNDMRSLFYLGKRSLRASGMLGMSIPPSLGKLETVLGWPAKAVTTLEHRLNITGYVLPGQTTRDVGLDEIAIDNNLAVEQSMTHVASLIHGTAFVTVTRGNEAAGEPPVIIAARSAREATALWSKRSRKITAGLTVNPAENGESAQLVMWLADRIVTIVVDKTGQATAFRQPHSLGYVPMELIAFRPHLEREFGTARISQSVMDLTASAVRTVIRMEGTAEFFSFPQRYALGVESQDFDDTFKAYLNRFLALGSDEYGKHPTVGQFSAASPQPHIEQLRATASLFSGETSIPLSYLGIVHDNPSSADAIRAAEADLITVAERAQVVYGAAWARVIRMAQDIRDGGPDPAMKHLQVQWRDAATPTKAATAQSVMSLVAAGVIPPGSRVTWELLGFDEATIVRLEAEAAHQKATQALNILKNPPAAASKTEQEADDDAALIDVH